MPNLNPTPIRLNRAPRSRGALILLFLCGALSLSAQTPALWQAADGAYTDAQNWSTGSVPGSATPIEIPGGIARLDAALFSRSDETRVTGGELLITGSYVMGSDAASTLRLSEGLFQISGPVVSLSDGSSSTVLQTGGEFSAEVGTHFYFSRRSGRSARVQLDGGAWQITYTGTEADPYNDYQLMGRGGDDTLTVNDGLFRLLRSGRTRRSDLIGDALITVNGGILEWDGFNRLSVGRDRPGEARIVVNDGELRMLNSNVDAGGIVLGDYTDGRLTLAGGTVRVTPSANASSRRSGLILGRKGKSDTGRSIGTLIQSGGTLDVSGLYLNLGDIGNVLTYGYGGRGRYTMTGGLLRARGVRTWDGGEFVDDEPGDSHFFFHRGEIELEGDQRDWPDQAFVISRSAISRDYDPVTDRTRLVATPPSNPAGYRYVRFTPLKRRGGGADVEIVQLAEFTFLLEGLQIDTTGVVVSNPGGRNPESEEPFRIVDGDPQTKWLDFDGLPLVFAFPQPVTFDAYTLTTANDFPDRDPLRWTLEGSHDGETWEILDRVATNYPLTKDRFAETLPFPLPAAVAPEPDVQTASLRYLRLVPLQARDANATHVEISRLEFYRDEERIVPIAIDALAEDGTGQTVRDRINDGRVRSQWRAPLGNGGLVFDFGDTVEMDAFLIAAGNGPEAEDPVRWRMESSLDGTVWDVVDDRSVYAFTGLHRRYAVSRITPFKIDFSNSPRLWRGFENASWDTESVNWLDQVPLRWENELPLQAEFGFEGPSEISVDQPIDVNTVRITAPGYVFSGAGRVHFTNSSRLDANRDAVLNIPISSDSDWRKTGPGVVVLQADATVSGAVKLKEGALRLETGSHWSGGSELQVAPDGGNRAVLRFTADGGYDFRPPTGNSGVGLGIGSSGAVLQEAGTVTLGGSRSGYLSLASAVNSYGFWHLAGGVLDAGGGGRSGVRVGDGGMGVFLQTGGDFFSGSWFSIAREGGGAGESTASFLGGTAVVDAVARINLVERADGIGTLNLGSQAGGTAVVSALSPRGITVGQSNEGNRAAVNLNSGTLILHGPLHRAGTGVSGIVNADGGTLRAASDDIDLLNDSLSAVTVHAKGLVIDSAGHDVRITADLQGSPGGGFQPENGRLALPVMGGGYRGAPLVRVTGTGSGSGSSAIAEMENGQLIGLLVTSPGQGYAVGDELTFSFHGGGADIPAADWSLTLEPEMISSQPGTLVKTGQGKLRLEGGLAFQGSLDLQQGELDIATPLVQQDVTVASGTTLSGSFTASNSIRLHGTLQLGNGALDGGGGLELHPSSTLELSFTTWNPSESASPGVDLHEIEFKATSLEPLQVRVDLSAVSDFAPGNRDFPLARAQHFSGFSPEAVELQIIGFPEPGSWRLLQRDGEWILAYREASASAFHDWAAQWESEEETGPTGDLNGNGVPNLLEYVLGTSPARDLPDPFLELVPTPSQPASIRLHRSAEALAAGRQWIEHSEDLLHWSILELPARSRGPVTIEPDPGNPGMEQVTVSLPLSDESAAPLFVRLRVDPFPELLP